MGTGTYNTTQNKVAQKTKSSESEFHTQENLIQSKNQKSNKVETQYSTSSIITQQKIIDDSDTSVSLVHGRGLFFSITRGTKVYFIA